MSGARVAVLVFPGTNSERETVRALHAVGLDARLLQWTAGAAAVRDFDAYVLPGGFSYEDRVRAGAIAAHEPIVEALSAQAQRGRLVLGLCNGAQILLEAGLVPGDGAMRRPSAAFAPNEPGGRFRSRLVHVKLYSEPSRSPFTAALPAGAVFPAWASHAEGRLTAAATELERIRERHLTFVYCDAAGNVSQAAVPNGSALGCAGLCNERGNVLALMPHPERVAVRYQLHDGARGAAAQVSAGGSAFFAAMAAALASAVMS